MFSSDLLQWLSQVLINRSDSFFPSHFALNLYTGNRKVRPLSSTKVSILQTRIFFYIGRPFMKLPLHISCRQHPMSFWLKGRAQIFGRCGPISRVLIFKLVECKLSFFHPFCSRSFHTTPSSQGDSQENVSLLRGSANGSLLHPLCPECLNHTIKQETFVRLRLNVEIGHILESKTESSLNIQI